MIQKLTSFLGLKTRFTHGVVWNMGSLVILGSAGIIMNAIIAKFAGAKALGVFNQVFAFYIALSQFSVGGIHFSVLKHTSYVQNDLKECSIITSSAFYLAALLAMIVGLITWFGAGLGGMIVHSEDVGIALRWTAPGLVAFSLNKVLLNLLNGLNRMKAYAVFQSLRYIFILLGVCLIIASPYSDLLISASLTFGEVLLLITLFLYTNIKVIRVSVFSVQMKWVRDHFSFGARGFFSGALGEIKTRVDVLILGIFTGDKIVGIYSFAAILAEGFSQLPIMIRRNVDPVLGESFASSDLARINKYSEKIKRTMLPIMAGVGVLAMLAYPIGLKLFLNDPTFKQSTLVFVIWMVGVILSSGLRPFIGILLQGGRPGMHTIMVGVLVLLQVAINFALIPFLGMYGAALAASVTLVLEAWFIYLFAKKILNIRL